MIDKMFLAFHVGPVQEFIATARRTQDLWIGSWLLSHLSRVAFKTAVKADGAEPILPNQVSEREEADADFPNHFIMALPTAGAEKIGRDAEQAVRDEWRRIERRTKEEFFSDGEGDVSISVWRERQTDNLLEIFWSLVDDDETTTARTQAQAALDARKRLRNFAQPPVGEPNLKCTLCGTRQELSEKTSVKAARAWWVALVKRYGQRPHLEKLRINENGNERLCAVCAVKRAVVAAASAQRGRKQEPAVPVQKTDASFPSTSTVAVATFRRDLHVTGRADSEFNDYVRALHNLNFIANVEPDSIPALAGQLPNNAPDRLLTFDGDLFYAETFTHKRIEADYPNVYNRILEQGVQELNSQPDDNYTVKDLLSLEPEYVGKRLSIINASVRRLYRAAGAKPSKYYAALMMDGDHMGQFFAKADKALAQDLSNRVSRFAREQARQIVSENFGRLVYAAADDVLALLPLATALKCARELQEGFKKAIEDLVASAGAKLPTPSAGVAIAHHSAPLDLTLQAMRRAEKSAKGFYGRDALCVHVLKRSGEELRVGTHWANGADESLVRLVEETVELLTEDKNVLSMKFAHAVAAEARALNGEDMPVGARIAALRRLAKRQSGKHFDEGKALSLAEKLARWSMTKQGPRGAERQLGMEEVAQWILLARFIAGGGRDEE